MNAKFDCIPFHSNSFILKAGNLSRKSEGSRRVCVPCSIQALLEKRDEGRLGSFPRISPDRVGNHKQCSPN